MISLDLGRALQRVGISWTPSPGDRFMVPDRDLDDHVFVVSDMVVEVRETPSGPLLAFNGTTEWALDSLEAGDAVWLPREDQLRTLIGPAFRTLESVGGGDLPPGFVVTVEHGGDTRRFVEVSPAAAYARALLALRA